MHGAPCDESTSTKCECSCLGSRHSPLRGFISNPEDLKGLGADKAIRFMKELSIDLEDSYEMFNKAGGSRSDLVEDIKYSMIGSLTSGDDFSSFLKEVVGPVIDEMAKVVDECVNSLDKNLSDKERQAYNHLICSVLILIAMHYDKIMEIAQSYTEEGAEAAVDKVVDIIVKEEYEVKIDGNICNIQEDKDLPISVFLVAKGRTGKVNPPEVKCVAWNEINKDISNFTELLFREVLKAAILKFIKNIYTEYKRYMEVRFMAYVRIAAFLLCMDQLRHPAVIYHCWFKIIQNACGDTIIEGIMNDMVQGIDGVDSELLCSITLAAFPFVSNRTEGGRKLILKGNSR